MVQFIKPAILGALVVFGSAAAFAQEISVPQGDVILTVTGDIADTNGDAKLEFDHAALAALPATTIETSTIWTDGVHAFTGVSLKDLSEVLGADEGIFLATAINDYSVEIPVSEAVEGGPIIAYLLDGDEMSIRDKGPLWVIYPFDSNAAYRSEVSYSRSIWQLDRIELVK